MASHLHNNLGFAYLRREHVSEVAGAFHRVLKLDSENECARNNLAAAYGKMGCTNNDPCGQWQEPDQPQAGLSRKLNNTEFTEVYREIIAG